MTSTFYNVSILRFVIFTFYLQRRGVSSEEEEGEVDSEVELPRRR